VPKRGQHDHSGGDPRNPYRNVGGPEGRHAKTHDVRREEVTNPKGPERPDESFALDLAERDPAGHLGPMHGHEDESTPAAADKVLHERLPELRDEELTRLSVLEPGTRLEQGGTYVDLEDPQRRPFTAHGGEEATQRNRFVAKRNTDYELWNRLVREDAPSRGGGRPGRAVS
jgi:hypothetical protein